MSLSLYSKELVLSGFCGNVVLPIFDTLCIGSLSFSGEVSGKVTVFESVTSFESWFNQLRLPWTVLGFGWVTTFSYLCKFEKKITNLSTLYYPNAFGKNLLRLYFEV